MKKILPLAILFLTILPIVTLAAECPDGAKICTFQQLPFLSNAAELTTEDYVNALYRIAISIAAILVVIRLIWAGVQYMLSEVVTSKEKAKKDIQGALLGLLIVLGAVTILNTINPQITDTNILGRLESAGGVNTPISTNSTLSGVPEYYAPKANEKLTAVTCPHNEVGTADCDTLINQCRSEESFSRVLRRGDTDKVYCYTYTGGRPACDGTVVAGTCYGTEEEIDLGDDFQNQRADIRRTECQRRGGEYDETRNICLQKF